MLEQDDENIKYCGTVPNYQSFSLEDYPRTEYKIKFIFDHK